MEQRDKQLDEAGHLLGRFRRGDMAAFELFYRIAAHPLRRYIHRRLPPTMRQDTEDIVQEVFIRVYNGAGSFREGYPAWPWLSGVARHVVAHHLRRHSPVLCDLAMIDDAVVNRKVSIPFGDVELLFQHVVNLIFHLSGKQRQAFQLVYINGMSRSDAAERLQCTLPQLRDRLREARKRLLALLNATELKMQRGGKPYSHNRIGSLRPARLEGASLKKSTSHPTFGPSCGNNIYDRISLSDRLDGICDQVAGGMMPAISPLTTIPDCALHLSRHFKSCRLSDGRTWLFNTSRLNPIQLDGSDQEAEELLSLLHNGRFNELPIDVVGMLRERGILLGTGAPDLSPEEVMYTGGPAREFRITMSGRIRNLPATEHGLEALGGYLRSCSPRYGSLRVIFECGDLAAGSLRDIVIPRVQWMASFLPFSGDAMAFCVNLRWNYVAANTEIVRMCLAPSLRLNILVERAVTDKEIQNITPLIKRWGFLPNIVIVLNQITSGCAQQLLEKLREQWGNDFQYSFSIPLRTPERALASYRVMLPTDDSIASLLCFIEQHPPLAHQNTLYSALKARMISYLDCGRMTDGVFVDGDGRFAPGLLAARRNPCHVVDAETFLSQLPRERGADAPANPANRVDALSSSSAIEACEARCEACPLKLWCGGICSIAGEPVKPMSVDLAVLELLCPVRMGVMTRLLTEALSTNPEASPVTARFQCRKGQISIVSSPASLPCVRA